MEIFSPLILIRGGLSVDGWGVRWTDYLDDHDWTFDDWSQKPRLSGGCGGMTSDTRGGGWRQCDTGTLPTRPLVGGRNTNNAEIF